MNEQGCRHSQSESWCPGGLCTCKPYSLTNALLCMGPTEALTPPTHLPYRSVCSAPANPVTFPNSTSVLFKFSPLIPSFPSSHSTDALTSYWTKKTEVNRKHFRALLSSNLSSDPMPSSLLILTPPISLASSRTWIVPSFFCNIGFSLPVGSFTSASCRSPHAGMSPVGGLPTRRWGRWGGEGEREEKGGEKIKKASLFHTFPSILFCTLIFSSKANFLQSVVYNSKPSSWPGSSASSDSVVSCFSSPVFIAPGTDSSCLVLLAHGRSFSLSLAIS